MGNRNLSCVGPKFTKRWLLVHDAMRSGRLSPTYCLHLGLIFKTSINFYPTTPRHIPEGNILFKYLGTFLFWPFQRVFQRTQVITSVTLLSSSRRSMRKTHSKLQRQSLRNLISWCHCLEILQPMRACHFHTRTSALTNNLRSHVSSEIPYTRTYAVANEVKNSVLSETALRSSVLEHVLPRIMWGTQVSLQITIRLRSLPFDMVDSESWTFELPSLFPLAPAA